MVTFEPGYPSGIIGDHTLITMTDDTSNLDCLPYYSFLIQSDRFTHYSLLPRVLTGEIPQGNQLNDLLTAQLLAHASTS